MGLRIIGGELRGRKIHTPSGRIIRPTSDRLRESIFDILSSNFQKVQDAVVIDLFAGTGALGLEALSRGAKFAVFIDNHKTALSAIAKNIQLCSLDGKAQVIRWDAIRNLNCLKSFAPAFGLVFVDPPYNQNMVAPALLNLQESRALEKDALIVVEHAVPETLPDDMRAFKLIRQKRYGKSLVSFFSSMI